MYLVKAFQKTKAVYTEKPGMKEFKKMCRGGDSFVLVKNHQGGYEYLKADMDLIPDYDTLKEHVAYVCNRNHVSDWTFRGTGITYETLKKSEQFLNTLDEIIDPVGSGHCVGIVFIDGYVILAEYMMDDLLRFHYDEK